MKAQGHTKQSINSLGFSVENYWQLFNYLICTLAFRDLDGFRQSFGLHWLLLSVVFPYICQILLKPCSILQFLNGSSDAAQFDNVFFSLVIMQSFKNYWLMICVDTCSSIFGATGFCTSCAQARQARRTHHFEKKYFTVTDIRGAESQLCLSCSAPPMSPIIQCRTMVFRSSGFDDCAI